jgi:hypothetical protein
MFVHSYLLIQPVRILRRTSLVQVCEIEERCLSAETLGLNTANFRDRVRTCLSAIRPQIVKLHFVTVSAFGKIHSLIKFTEVSVWQFQYLKINSISGTLKVFEFTSSQRRRESEPLFMRQHKRISKHSVVTIVCLLRE